MEAIKTETATTPQDTVEVMETTETAEESTLLDQAGDEKPATDSQENTDVKAEGEKPKEGKTADKVIPEKYEFKLPEGMALDAAMVEVFTPIFKELGLDQAGAQKLVDAYVPMVNKTADQIRQESLKDFKEMVDGWKAESLKSLGAEAKTKLALCGKALNKFGTPELRAMLSETGVGNHPELVKFMAQIGASVSEDTFVDGQSHQLSGEDATLKRMYPSMKT